MRRCASAITVSCAAGSLPTSAGWLCTTAFRMLACRRSCSQHTPVCGRCGSFQSSASQNRLYLPSRCNSPCSVLNPDCTQVRSCYPACSSFPPCTVRSHVRASWSAAAPALMVGMSVPGRSATRTYSLQKFACGTMENEIGQPYSVCSKLSVRVGPLHLTFTPAAGGRPATHGARSATCTGLQH
jgi:hypothetical protein